MTRQRSTFLTIFILLIALVAGGVSWWIWGRAQPVPEGLIQANGRIEGDTYTVASKLPGRIAEIDAREGDAVEKDQKLARLDSAQINARVRQAEATLALARATLEASRAELATLRQQVPLEIATAKSNVAHAKAALQAARARAKQAERDAERARELRKKWSISKEDLEKAELAATVAKADEKTAAAAVDQAEKLLAEAQLGEQKVAAKEAMVNAAEARVKQAEAALAEARSTLEDTVIKAPASGIVTQRIIDVGEVVTAGSPLFDIVDLDRLYLKVYVPEKEIGKVHRGLPARIYTDAFPDNPFPATVRYIASRAEFTPKEVQTPDERVKLVYEVRLYLDTNPDHKLTPGLPADSMIRWKDDASWVQPRW